MPHASDPNQDSSDQQRDDDLEHFKTIDVEKAFGCSFSGRTDRNVFCPHCEDPGVSKSRSCSVNQMGVYSCKTCGAHGTATDFYAILYSISRGEALKELSVDSTVDSSDARESRNTSRARKDSNESRLTWENVKTCAAMLEEAPHFLKFLAQRGLSAQTIAQHHIGCDEHRITIPVIDEDGQVRNIRRYLPHPKSAPRCFRTRSA